MQKEIVLILVAVYSHGGAADAVAEKPSSMIRFPKYRHSLSKKAVAQLQPKSTTGSSFYWSISGTFVGGCDSSPRKKNLFRVSV